MKNRKMNERISQLIDQELDAGQQGSVIDEMIRHESAGRTWQRYQMIGDITRGDIDRVGTDLTDRIRARLQAEPTVIALRPLTRDNRIAGSGSSGTGMWKPVGLFALAASLAVVAMITLGPIDDSARYGTVAAVDQAAAPAVDHVIDQAGDQTGSGPPVMEFNELLAGHGEFTASPAFNGLLAHMVLVGNQTLVR